MRKTEFFIYLVVMVSLAGFNPLGKIAAEPASRGGELQMHVDVVNDMNRDFDDTNVAVFLYDIGEIFYSGEFDLEDNAVEGLTLFWNVPYNIKPGEYIARITASNDEFRDVKHVYLRFL